MITREQRDDAVKVLVQWGRQAVEDELSDGQAMALALSLGVKRDLAGRVLGNDKSMWLVPGIEGECEPVTVKEFRVTDDGLVATVYRQPSWTKFIVSANRLYGSYKAALAKVRDLTEQAGAK